ncbi:MAG TPA: CDP-alcohol phosphatidyltransferase family protein [Aliidongia sp.]|uniref:CDP-alcohol phosphatidyltransferase family protein n=1 Tax=Aliidongia sp. TaxID=1914230 RepID=UPI002DDCAFDE|nr:CDP-alcohol phosphatidyltransferase family protein [Aliidongia sp.]HEV2675322.1 CDP-alcohol phosphatidyltransferase family protein [Aliidongia sp.]
MDRATILLTLAGIPAWGVLIHLDPGLSPALGTAALAGWLCYALVVRGAMVRAGLSRWGWANGITLLRGLLVALMVPFLFASGSAGWLPILLGAAALALDGMDGPLARRSGLASPFGARFDMETDALTVLMLSALVAADGRVGAWVLSSGALRYLYVAAGEVWPALRRAPPPSFARKLVCVLQIAGLLVALMPILVPPWPAIVAGISLMMLFWSFGRDAWGLMRDQGMAESSAAPYLSDTGGV